MSGGRRLSRHVHVRDDRGRPHVFGPDDDVPAWAAAKVTSRTAWAPAEEPASTSEPPELRPPPRSGRGSSRTAWATYAEQVGVNVGADDDRDAIIAVLAEAGHPAD